MTNLTANEVTFTVTIEADDTDPRGCFENDNGGPDYEVIDPILERLRAGDDSAWCGVVVIASWRHRGRDYTGRASLWGCSLNDDYTEETVVSEYDLRSEALADLNANLAAEIARLASLRAVLI